MVFDAPEQREKRLAGSLSELERVVAEQRADDVHLIRFGLFNMTEETIESEQITHPIELTFSEGTTILSALYGEALKTERYNEAEPAVHGQTVTLPMQRMKPKSTLIYNFILRGGVERSMSGENGRVRHD